MARWNDRRRLLDHAHSDDRHRPELKNVAEPNLMRSVFPYDQVPVIDFDHHIIMPEPPARMLITDTTFRDGQQARPPYKAKQIGQIYKLLSKLSGPRGVIRQSEFFLYSDKDRRAVDFCRELDLRFPEITGWIRAVPEDIKLVKEMEMSETGILTSVSDYHIYMKLGLDRTKALDKYLAIVKEALSLGVTPRCHFEDLTRADIHGFVIPFAAELMKLRDESKLDIKIRLCDTMGYGVSYPGAALPRSVPKLIRAMIDEAGVPGHLLEWHGHNDFHKVLVNAATAWLYGCGTVNGSIFGFGERTGNAPIEGMVMEYMSLTGSNSGMEPEAITELAEYFRTELGTVIPANYPFVGAEFNATSAGVHADGLVKNEEIYNIFDTKKILGRPISIIITDTSGAAGVAYWVNSRLELDEPARIDKRHPGIIKIYKRVMAEYESGRTTSISGEEMEKWARKYLPDYFESEFDVLKRRAGEIAAHLVEELIERPEMTGLETETVNLNLAALIEENPFIQFAYVANAEGNRLPGWAVQVKSKASFKGLSVDEDVTDRSWFQNPLADGQVHVSDFYTSRWTKLLCITVSGPIRNEEDEIVAILGIDIQFEDLVKMEKD